MHRKYALLNARDLVKVIKWNNDHGIKMYRLSSDIFPWASEYEFRDLPDFNEIHQALLEAGVEAKRCGTKNYLSSVPLWGFSFCPGRCSDQGY